MINYKAKNIALDPNDKKEQEQEAYNEIHDWKDYF